VKKHKIEILPVAWENLREIGEYISQDSPLAATAVVDDIMVSLRRLETFPFSAPLSREKELARNGFRSLVCGKYLCLYKVLDDTVYVYHIVHGTRNYPVLFEFDGGK